MELNQVVYFFLSEAFVGSEKTREVTRKEKMEKTETRKEVYVELFMVE